MNTNDYSDEEINVKELVSDLWAGRNFILASIFTFLIATSTYLHNADRLFTVSTTLMPVSGGEGSSALDQLGGLAPLAGLSMLGGGSSDFDAFQALLTSDEVAKQLMANEFLVRQVFIDEWNEELEVFLPRKNFLQQVVMLVKALLIGESGGEYIPPNSARLLEYLDENMEVSRDIDTGYLVLSAEHKKPEVLISLMNLLVRETDLLLKERYLAIGSGDLAYYQAKLAQARTQEHRYALVQLIVSEEQKLMLATRESAYSAKILSGPVSSLRPTKPAPLLILTLSIFLSVFVGGGIVLIRKHWEDTERN